jgi:hypothetical protein
MFSTRTIALIAALAAAPALAHAQEPEPTPGPAPGGADEPFHKGTLGFSLPVTLLSNVATVLGTVERVPTVDIVYFLSDKAAVDLIVGVNFHRQQVTVAPGMTESSNLFGFAAGVGYRMYKSKNNLRSYIEPQLVLAWADTSASESLALSLGAQMGLERNITPWFSFSGTAGLGLSFANSFDDIQLATTAGLAANMYWH